MHLISDALFPFHRILFTSKLFTHTPREEFRKQFNKDHPENKAVSAVGKAAGAKWKQMSDAEKAPYVAKSEKRKQDYEKNMRAYNKKQAEGPTGGDEEESDKSISEVNDEDDDEDGSGEEDDDE
ncbi:HMG1/2-like protein isoform X2 [Arachis ipaensis]|uniref:HMG1/2-like protein isoform X2 n=1 Tax=Arachis ipaensis TaxID=130454 RepID=UPI000A2B296A|nr:HMG1/2-like protein isoform X2 [Arachis ipaensis]XP_025665760.1 HMG1/2-like protein isoform X2 [Arachis hypogaea]